MHTERHVRLFKNGRNQALRIPRDFELPGDKAIISKEGEGKRYLLNTNILSDLVRNPKGLIARRIEAVGEETVCTSLIVSADLRFGTRKIAPAGPLRRYPHRRRNH